ncbi:cytochrome P450 [Triangularia verruculosa]|uniref:Cytochrome P450 n=1 Tax=Triangularia verruculosa TaxID=2587418 RepID=A0AAN6XMM3_9PEZI|nr:cytochrome P450 [Triangularia verruculosa]
MSEHLRPLLEAAPSFPVALLGFLFVCLLALCVYRLYLSPLAQFPGPRIAVLTGWYEFYYDIILDGEYVFKIEQLHKEYGPIIRINPWELHASDPILLPQIYSSGVKRRVEKYSWSQSGLRLIEESHFLTESHELHRLRRKPLGTFFSQKNIDNMEPAIWQVSQRIRIKLQTFRGSESVANMNDLFTAVSADLVAALAFDEVALNNRLYKLVKQQFDSSRAARSAFSKLPSPLPDETDEDELLSPDTKLIAHLLHSNLPEQEKTTERVCAELLTVFTATVFNIPRAMVVTTYHILANPAMKKKLCQELDTLLGPDMGSRRRGLTGDTPIWVKLNQAEYLKACVKEGVRLVFGPLRSTARRNLDAPIVYKGWVIPPGTPVGMSAWLLNTDPEVWGPDPLTFRPERWLPGNHKAEMDRNFASMGKGSRTCLGIHLVYVFMRHLLAAMFGPGDQPELRLYETEESDVATTVSGISGIAKKEARGLRVVVR